MSKWTTFRNEAEEKIAAVFEPAIQKGIAFLHDVESLAEAQGASDVESAATAGSATFVATPGDEEAKLLAGLAAFGSSLLGYAITIVKEAKAEVEGSPAPATAK